MNPLRRVSPFTSRLRRYLGLSNGIQETAYRSWTLSPAVESWVQPAIFETTDLGKVTGGSTDSKLIEEFSRTIGRTATHGATVAYELREAVLTRGHLFTLKASHPINARTRLPIFATAITSEYSEAALASSWLGIKYFGHWMTDDLPRLLAAQTIGYPISQLTAPTPSQRDYSVALGMQPDIVTDAYFKRIVILDDFGQNGYKRERFNILKKKAAPHGVKERSAKVMLLRGNSGSPRILSNELELPSSTLCAAEAAVSPAKTST